MVFGKFLTCLRYAWRDAIFGNASCVTMRYSRGVTSSVPCVPCGRPSTDENDCSRISSKFSGRVPSHESWCSIEMSGVPGSAALNGCPSISGLGALNRAPFIPDTFALSAAVF